MRLLYICDALAVYGGLERVLIEKANWLAKQEGYEVCLLTVNQGEHPVCFPLHPDVQFEDLGIQFHQQYQLPLWKRVVRNRQLHRLFRERLTYKIQENASDIIICTRLDYIRDVISVKGDKPLVFESHSSCLASRFEGDGLLRRIHIRYLQLAVRKAAMTVALTQGDADEWRKLTPRVCVIPNVVHLNESGLYSDCTAKSAIFVGRFSKQKNVGSILHIWKLVHDRFPDWCLHIYGGYGEEQDSILAKIKQMDANIQVHEATSNMMEKYRESSILLMTSSYEPFGLVLPEAMSCGLPVVAFDCPYGPADIITDGTDGFLVKERSYDDFSNKVCQLMDYLDLRIKMGKSGIESSNRYAESRIMPLWKQLFDRLVQQ
jgi:glycosyltransferase involved in cell wall biosynthesis